MYPGNCFKVSCSKKKQTGWMKGETGRKDFFVLNGTNNIMSVCSQKEKPMMQEKGE